MYRYGSSVTLDAVEMKYMGQPPNFGSIARYAVHFHLSGYNKSFRGYLPDHSSTDTDSDFRRNSKIVNCSNWCCLLDGLLCMDLMK